MDEIKLARLLTFALRHKPQALGLKLDKNKYVKVDDLLNALEEHGHDITLGDIVSCVELDDKGRFEYNASKKIIRCTYGHSAEIASQAPDEADYNYKLPSKLYHGSSVGFLSNVLVEGLTPQGRTTVHLTANLEVAKANGERYSNFGPLVVYEIDTRGMLKDGLLIGTIHGKEPMFVTKFVPPTHLKVYRGK